MIKSNIKNLQFIRKKLRLNSTPAEKRLWFVIRNKKIDGYKFRRQHSIGEYVIDFYCSEIKLAIEVDGGIHYFLPIIIRDNEKAKYLNSLGIRIIRIHNKDIFNNIDYVILYMKSVINNEV
ncbi:MAG: endonuclease domain-containing protein [bacterium]